MKKTLLSIAVGLFATGASFAQCTPDSQYANEEFGLWPDTIPFVQACAGCGDATRVIDIVTLTDTALSVSGISATIYFRALKIAAVDGIPTGLVYGTDVESAATAESPFGEWENGGPDDGPTTIQGCVYINGAEAAWTSLIGGGPNSDGIYPLDISVDAKIASTNPSLGIIGISDGDWLSSVDTSFGGGVIHIVEYFLDVRQGSVGINDLDPSKLGILDNFPNPFTGHTTVQYSSPKVDNLTFSVYSILGNEVYSKSISAKQGLNAFDFDATSLPSGLYIYSISNGNSTATRKMTVK